MINFIKTFKQVCEQIYVGTWAQISDAQHGFNERLNNRHELGNRHKGAN
jgi:hypothetical protein